jgi:hypothetical protein
MNSFFSPYRDSIARNEKEVKKSEEGEVGNREGGVGGALSTS